MSALGAALVAASLLARLMDESSIEFGMSCAEIQRIESSRADVDLIFYPGGKLRPDSSQVYGRRASGVLFHYRCDSRDWSALVALSNLGHEYAMELLTEAKLHFSTDGCAPSLDMHELTKAEKDLVHEENKWRRLKRYPYVVWRTDKRERVISAIPYSQDSDKWEVSLEVRKPRPHYFEKPEIPVIQCF